MTVTCADCLAAAPGHEGQVPLPHPRKGTGPDGPPCGSTKTGLPYPAPREEEKP